MVFLATWSFWPNDSCNERGCSVSRKHLYEQKTGHDVADRSLDNDEPRQSGGVVRLVPFSGLQFIDLSLGSGLLALTHSRYLEDHDDERGSVLIPLTVRPDYEGVEWHPATNRALAPEETLWLTGYGALEPYLGMWLPLPFLRIVDRDPASPGRHDNGPGNWARIFLQRPEGDLRQANLIKAAIAFDTRIDPASRLDIQQYHTPNIDDVHFGAEFALATEPTQLAEFLAEPWLDDWLSSSYAAWKQRHDGDASGAKGGAGSFALEHIARYLTLLTVIERTGAVPRVRFGDTLSAGGQARTAGVDLMLDIGDDRTAAILVGSRGAGTPAPADAAELQIRDLSNPVEMHMGPFATAGEFDRPSFGNAAASRRSGRPDAFAWPSLMRVGAEGRRLSLRASATPGLTGMTNLRSALANSEARSAIWRFSRADDQGSEPGPVVAGEMLAHVTEDGSVIGSSAHALAPALRPRFSPSALLGLFAAEVVLHAMAQINRPAAIGDAGEARYLRRLIVTCPAAASDEERRLLLGRIEGGIDLVWAACGWSGAHGQFLPGKPVVTAGLDAGLSAQLLYLYDEVAGRFGGDMRQFAGLTRGTEAAPGGTETLTIASLDFTSAATGLAIVEYNLGHDSAVRPQLVLADRSQVGGASLIDAIAAAMIVPAIGEALAACGHPQPWQLLETALACGALPGDAGAGPGDGEPGLAEKVVQRIIRPAASAFLDLYQDLPQGVAGAGLHRARLGDLVERGGGRLEPVGGQVEAMATRQGAEGFDLAGVCVDLSPRAVSRLLDAHLEPLFARVAEVVEHYDCDLLLLTGPFSRLPRLKEQLVNRLALAPHRIVMVDDRSLDLAGRDTPARSAGDRLRLLPLVGGTLAGGQAFELGGLPLLVDELSQQRHRPNRAGLESIGLDAALPSRRIAHAFDGARIPADATALAAVALEGGR